MLHSDKCKLAERGQVNASKKFAWILGYLG